MKIAVISFTSRGKSLAHTVKEALEARGHQVWEAVKNSQDERSVTEPLSQWTGRQFQEREAIIFIGAAGIAVRAIAPWIQSKAKDPAVLVADEGGRYCIPILSGHIGGANALACELEKALSMEAVLTTGAMAAQVGGISEEAMKLEVQKAAKQLRSRQKKQWDQKALAPAAAAQPGVREIRYDNVRSARAEEGVLQLVLKEPALLDRCPEAVSQRFSSPLLAKVLDLLRQQYEEGLTVQLGSLGDRLTAQEMSHLTAVAQKGDVLVNEQALDDYLSVIDEEYEKAHVADTEDLLAMGQRLRRKKGFGGTEQ